MAKRLKIRIYSDDEIESIIDDFDEVDDDWEIADNIEDMVNKEEKTKEMLYQIIKQKKEITILELKELSGLSKNQIEWYIEELELEKKIKSEKHICIH